MDDAQVGWIAAIIIGGVAGWLAEQFMKSEMGLLMNIVLGIIGAAVASAILSFFGDPPRGMDRLPYCRVHRRGLADLDRAGCKGPASLRPPNRLGRANRRLITLRFARWPRLAASFKRSVRCPLLAQSRHA